MGMALVKQEQSIQPRSIDDLLRLGELFRRSGYFKNVADEAQAVTKILYGMELGFSPVVSMMGIYIVDGKPALSGNLLGAMVKRSGKYDFTVKTMTDKECSIDFRQLKREALWEIIGTSTFTMDDAKNAGLAGKDPWRKYPKAMLYNRALSAGVRAFCPDVSVSPVYVPEELGADVTEEGEVLSIPEAKPEIAEPITLTREVAKPEPQPSVTIDTDEESPYITTKQKSHLARRFRESCRPEMEPDADKFRHAALEALNRTGWYKSKLVDEHGNPTSDYVLKTEYEHIGKELVKAAKSL